MAKITRTSGPSNASAELRPTVAVEVVEPEPVGVLDASEAEPVGVAEEPVDESNAEPAAAGRRRGTRSTPEEPQT